MGKPSCTPAPTGSTISFTFFDFNRIQNYSRIDDTNELEPLADKLRAFNWEVVEINGNDIDQVLEVYDKALVPGRGKPFAIVGHTKLGKGVSFMEDVVVFHSKAPARDKLAGGFKELGVEFPHEEVLKFHDDYTAKVAQELNDKDPKFSKDYSWNSGDDMEIESVWDRQSVSPSPSRHAWIPIPTSSSAPMIPTS